MPGKGKFAHRNLGQPMVPSVLTALDELSAAEQACLELAWQALLAGYHAFGRSRDRRGWPIIGSGRKAVYGAPDPTMLSGSLLARRDQRFARAACQQAALWMPTGGIARAMPVVRHGGADGRGGRACMRRR